MEGDGEASPSSALGPWYELFHRFPFDLLLRLMGLQNRVWRQHAAEMGERINHGVASQNRARAYYRVATDLGAITNDGAELTESGCDATVFVSQMDFFPVQSHICQNHSCPQVSFITENGVTDIVKMRDFGAVEHHAIFKLAGVTKDHSITHDYAFADIAATADLAIIPDPGWTFNGRTVFDDGFVTDIHHFANKRSAQQSSVNGWIKPKLEIAGDLLQNIPDLGRVIEERSVLCLAQVEVI